MLEVDWFKGIETLAIADIVYVEGIGLCSHQPDFSGGGHRVMDYIGYYYKVETNRLFLPSQDELRLYWLYRNV